MAPEAPVETTSTSTTTGTPSETPEAPQQSQQTTTPETGGNGTPQASTPQEPVRLPDDHPLVKTLAANKEKISSLNTELSELRTRSQKVTQLEADLSKRPTQEAMDTLQKRYDRLEAFLQESGGDIGKALDSRSFTRDLFESDKDIADIVKDWNAANPSPTSVALGSAAAAPAKKGPAMNDILRAAIK